MDNTLQQQPQQSGTPERLPHCGGDEGRPNITTPHMNGAASGGIAGGLIGGGGSANRLPSHRRPQTTQMSPSIEQKVLIPTQLLTLTINKDSNGYGMKVSGDNPVYVESVKPGGAAQKAGLIAGDMILKVNGVEVRSEKHTTVVQLIKSHVVVDLTVKRSQKMQRPSSVGIGPSTPLPQRDRTASITGPQPVDNAKRREMEFSKIKTLQLMLEQEKKNLENLKATNSVNNRQDRSRAETNIRKLQEQLRQVGGEESSLHFLTTSPPTIISPSSNHQIATTPQPQHSSPAFLSRFPRSLSSLSLGTRKKTEKEITSPFSNNVIVPPPELSSALSPTQSISQGVHTKVQPHSHQVLPNATPVKKRFTGSERNLKEDIPPPLPQRNPPRITPDPNTPPNEWRRNIPVSDLDHSMSVSTPSPKINTSAASGCTGNSAAAKVSANKKRPKTKMKALSDPKMSTQMFLQMEKEGSGGDNIDSCTPPPLPPRQPGMMEENQNILNSKMSGSGGIQSRPLPNSVDTLMKYPLVATCTSVRDNMSAAFPLSQRPNIVQQLQQHQQHLHQLHHNPSTHSSTSVSKPTVLGQTPPQHMNHLHKHRRVVSSPEHIQPRHERHLDFSDRHNKSSSGSWELIEKDNEVTPPGTPPPPYLSSHLTQSQTVHHGDDPEQLFIDHSTTAIASPTHPTFPNQILAAQANTIQKEIISMEDEEISDQECIDEHGPFNYLQRLLEPEHVAHLAVFLNYVLSNSDPAPLLFYLITGLYKEGTVKDMRKWAYEIHSTFLVPCAPLLWFNVDESLAREVDNVLQNEYDKAEILRKVFWKSRKKAKEKICDQLRDFQQKRTAGLGTMYGPSDQQLAEAKNDKVQQQKIFEDHILPKLQNLVDELDKEAPYECPKKLALCSALSTVLHRIFVTRSLPGSPIDRVHHFVSREKSFKSRLMGKNRKMVVRGHPLVLRQYYEVTHCNHCQTIIWGVSPQGYHCTDCKLNIHRPCSKVLEESCPGPVPQKRKEQHSDKKISKFMGKIRPTHSSQNERRRMDEDSVMDDFLGMDRPHSTSVVRQPSDRRPDLTNTSISSGGTASHNTSELTTSQYLDADTSALDADHDSKRGDRSKSKSAPVSVNRSESYKERLSHKRNRNNRRKTSDPSLSKTNDEQTEVGLSNDNYTASSSSSISSGSLESPSSSLEQVSGPGGHSAVGGPMTTATGTVPTPRQWVDSEDEAELIELDWSSHVSPEILAALSDAEKKRQEIINEIFQTERNHVRTLRLLEGLFMRPLQESNVLPHDHLQILFPPALLSLKDLHSSFEQKLKLRRVENGHIVRNVGDLLVGMFEGHSGDDLREYAAQFCAHQQIALEALKEKRRKDENLQRLLTKAESHKACRRLQLKDLLPTVLQRLTKYPLLFENLYKITKRVNPDDEREADAIQRALDSSKRILVDVNQAVKSAEDAHKLQTIQRKLDKSSFDKDASNEFKNLDLTQFKLVYDGQLTMKKNPGVQLHGLLFENMMVLLQKQDDKYFLKYFPNLAAGTNENNKLISPITHFDQQTLVRQSAVDKNTFFLIITKTSQMLELRAPSSSECKTWFKHISDAAEQYKPRSKSSHEVVEDPATSTLPHSNTKESLEAAATSAERSASTAGSNNNFSADNSTTSGYQQQEQSQINTSTPSEKGKITYSNNNNTTLDTQRENKYESNNNASNQKLDGGDDKGCNASNPNETRRDSVYSNNSNNTRTLMQHCPLLEPSEIQISISPALTAEPILTPTEKLRRLDESIRERLAEKQKIICDMFRVPNEHFTAIADIAAQPEAPKDPSDIVLAAFAQVQSLTEVLSEYMKITPEQEISAVSTAVCDQCHQRSMRSISPLPSSIASTNTGTTIISYPDASGVGGGCSSNKDDLEFAIVLEDDGYCEIDPLRLPSVMPNPNQTTPGLKPLPTTTSGHISTSTPELIKRQSTISADSIPEESEQDITHEEQLNNSNSMGKDKNNTTLQSDTPSEETQKVTDDSLGSEHIEVNETYDSAASLNKGISTSNLKTSNNQLCTVFATELELCGPNRLTHVQNLEPSIPCHVISGFVTALSAQISLLLPKINERDIERERLRRENQHLRELLNAMHERQRVEDVKETPDNTKSAENSQEIPDKIPEQQPSSLSPEQE